MSTKFFVRTRKNALSGAFSFLVAGGGIEPPPTGYEPVELPVLYPAMFQAALFRHWQGYSIQRRKKWRKCPEKRPRVTKPQRPLNIEKLAEHLLVQADDAPRIAIAQRIIASLMGNLIANLVGLPGILQGEEIAFLHALQLFADGISLIPYLVQHVAEHDVGLQNGEAPIGRIR